VFQKGKEERDVVCVCVIVVATTLANLVLKDPFFSSRLTFRRAAGPSAFVYRQFIVQVTIILPRRGDRFDKHACPLRHGRGGMLLTPGCGTLSRLVGQSTYSRVSLDGIGDTPGASLARVDVAKTEGVSPKYWQS
jgi:hypothetical protein